MTPTVEIRGRLMGDGRPVYILAEMACAHDGSPEKAKRLIDAAKAAKADGVQLQFFCTDELVTPNNKIHSLLKRIELDREQWRDIHAHARQSGLDVWACTFDLPSVALAGELGVDGIKLNSSDLASPDMIRAVSALGIPFTLGTGASTLEEIAQALDVAREAGGEDIVLMHGVQNFPTALKDANLKRIKLLRSLFPNCVGYADHTDASLPEAKVIDLTALGMGACLLEKHITLDRSEKGVDYQAALEPQELKEYVAAVRGVETGLGSDALRPLTESDKQYRKFQKKSIVAARDLTAGQAITGDTVRFLRTGGTPAIPPSRFSELDGRILKEGVSAMTPIKMEHLAES
ncbi:MAG: N-acetylneuraminate synthase family protein [Desulfovibrionaceae bacterium]|nr:N-acetylneuraminate synthase family protein [Desulfovibrionaceae bacterium]